jgi:hypothetical protein
VTEQRDWPLEQSAKGALRPWHYTAVGYLAVLFADFEEAERAQRGLRERGVSEGDLRLYDGEETLRIASRLERERSIVAKAIDEIVIDHRAEERRLDNAEAGGAYYSSSPPPGRCQPDGGFARGLPLRVAGLLRRAWCGGPRNARPAPDDHTDRHSGS